MLSISPRLLLGPLSCCCCYPGRLFWHLSLSTLSGIAVSAVVIVMITDSLKPSLLSISALSVVAVWSLTLTPSQLPISILSGVAISAVDVDVVADWDAFTAAYFCPACCCGCPCSMVFGCPGLMVFGCPCVRIPFWSCTWLPEKKKNSQLGS